MTLPRRSYGLLSSWNLESPYQKGEFPFQMICGCQIPKLKILTSSTSDSLEKSTPSSSHPEDMERLFYEIVGADAGSSPMMTLEMYKAGTTGVEDTPGKVRCPGQAAVQHEEFLMALGIVHRGWKNAGS